MCDGSAPRRARRGILINIHRTKDAYVFISRSSVQRGVGALTLADVYEAVHVDA